MCVCPHMNGSQLMRICETEIKCISEYIDSIVLCMCRVQGVNADVSLQFLIFRQPLRI